MIRYLLILFMLLFYQNGYALGYCSEPRVPSCINLSFGDTFDDEYDLNRCELDMDRYSDEVERYRDCLTDKIDDAVDKYNGAVDEYDDAVDKFECEANDGKYC